MRGGCFVFSISQKPLHVLCDMKYTECGKGIRCSILSCNCSKYLGAKITSNAEVFCSGDGRSRKIFWVRRIIKFTQNVTIFGESCSSCCMVLARRIAIRPLKINV